MPYDLYFLADSDDGNMVKVIFGIIALLVWGVGALASSVKKSRQQEEQRQRQMLEQAREEVRLANARRAAEGAGVAASGGPHGQVRRVPAPPPPPPAYMPAPPPGYQPVPPPMPDWMTRQGTTARVPPPVPPTPQLRYRSPQPPPPPPRRPKTKRQRPPAAPPAVAVFEEALRPVATPIRGPAATIRRAPGVAGNAAALSRWLTPQTLRSQFMLTEILQPPLALRESREV